MQRSDSFPLFFEKIHELDNAFGLQLRAVSGKLKPVGYLLVVIVLLKGGL